MKGLKGYILLLLCVLLVTTASCGKRAEPDITDGTAETEISNLDTDEVTDDVAADSDETEAVTDQSQPAETHIPDTPDTASPEPVETEPVETDPPETRPAETEPAETEPAPKPAEIRLTLTDAPDDVYTNPSAYESCMHSDSPYARNVMLTSSADLKDFKFFIYDLDRYMTDSVCEITEVLYSSPNLSTQKPFVARIWIPEFISSYGISYTDSNGETAMLMFCESGLDGSVLLSAFY